MMLNTVEDVLGLRFLVSVYLVYEASMFICIESVALVITLYKSKQKSWLSDIILYIHFATYFVSLPYINMA